MFEQILEILSNPVVFVPLGLALVAGIDRLVQKTDAEWDNKVWFKFVRKPLAAWLGKKNPKP